MPQIAKTVRVRLFAGLLLLITAVLGVFAWAYFVYPNSTDIGGKSLNKGENGLWLRYLWYAGDSKYWSSVDQMIEHLKNDQIKFAYFHVRELKPDGHLALRYEDRAKKLTTYVHANAGGVKVLAWIALGSAYPAHGIDLSNEAVRKNAVAEAVWLTAACGFDGVQWDYEPCVSGDENFLSLLRETRNAIPPEKTISVATPMCLQVGEAPTWYYWNESYFTKVASLTDQVAVMCYDLVEVFPWQYVSAVKKQVPSISTAVAQAGTECKVVFGLPAYDRGFRHDHCETLRLALKAVRESSGLPGVKLDAISGVAVFADYTMDEGEWRAYRKYWLENDAK